MDSLAALILDGHWRWVRQAVQASAASYGESCRPIGTSNGAGSRADSSRGPWSSAELAPRPVRRGRSKPQKNALDSSKMRGMQSWIPGAGRGLKSIPHRRFPDVPEASGLDSLADSWLLVEHDLMIRFNGTWSVPHALFDS